MVKGAAQLHQRLTRIPDRVEKSVRKVLEQEADYLVGQMKALAPVLKKPDARRRAGALRDSIRWTWGPAPKGTAVLGRVATREPKGNRDLYITIYAGTRDKSLGVDDAWYAHFLEFGTETMAASPYFYPVWRANRSRVRARIVRTAKREFRRI